MDAALTRYNETVLGPVLATLSDDRPFRETMDSLIDLATREETPDVPSGCLFRVESPAKVSGSVASCRGHEPDHSEYRRAVTVHSVRALGYRRAFSLHNLCTVVHISPGRFEARR